MLATRIRTGSPWQGSDPGPGPVPKPYVLVRVRILRACKVLALVREAKEFFSFLGGGLHHTYPVGTGRGKISFSAQLGS